MTTRATFDQFRQQLGATPAAATPNRLMMMAGEQPQAELQPTPLFPAFVRQMMPQGQAEDSSGNIQPRALTPQERQEFQARMAQGNMFQRTLGTLDRKIQESQGLLALAPLGLFGGANVPLQAASFFQGFSTNQPVSGGMGVLGRALQQRMSPSRRIDPNTLTGGNITPSQAAALAATQRSMVPERSGDRNESVRERNQRNFESRSRDLAERSARGGGLPY